MGSQIIRQPNDDPEGEPLFCLFSNNVDDIVLYDASYDDVVDYFTELAAADARRTARRYLDAVLAGERAYAQFTMSLDEALADVRRVHGAKREKKRRKQLRASAPEAKP